MVRGAAGCGWFGKIACLGDFGARRLPAPFVQCCDTWLSGGLAASREQLGEAWLPTYLSAPLWRFAWAPGLAGPGWWLGVLMPSVDRVGRYFPLVAAQGAEHVPLGSDALQALQAWYDHVAEAALATLQPEATPDAFDARLAAAPPWPRHDERIALPLAELEQRLQGRSLWLAQRGPQEPAHFSVASGLPAAERFAELLRGGRW